MNTTGIVPFPNGDKIYLLRKNSKSRVENDYQIPAGNFMNTQMCLVGVLRKNETLDQWAERVDNYLKSVEKENNTLINRLKNDMSAR